MYRDILLPTDGSEATETVLDHTVEIASGRDARVHVLYVVDDRAFLTLEDEMKDEVIADLRDEGETAIADVADQLEAAGLDAATRITKGKPADEIISYIEDNDIDLVTMGTRAGEYTNNILGSTAQKVVTDAPVPVVSVDIAEA